MPVFETYASRLAAVAKAGTPDVYTYDDLPPLLRKQISKIFTESIGPGWREPKGFVPGADVAPHNANKVWREWRGSWMENFCRFPYRLGTRVLMNTVWITFIDQLI